MLFLVVDFRSKNDRFTDDSKGNLEIEIAKWLRWGIGALCERMRPLCRTELVRKIWW